MPITYEKIEALFGEKFQETLNPLTKQIENIMKNIKYASENTTKSLDYWKKATKKERYRLLRTRVLKLKFQSLKMK